MNPWPHSRTAKLIETMVSLVTNDVGFQSDTYPDILISETLSRLQFYISIISPVGNRYASRRVGLSLTADNILMQSIGISPVEVTSSVHTFTEIYW